MVSFDLTNKSFKRRELFFFHRVKMRSIRNSWFLLKNKQVVIRRQESKKSKFQDVESFHKNSSCSVNREISILSNSTILILIIVESNDSCKLLIFSFSF